MTLTLNLYFCLKDLDTDKHNMQVMFYREFADGNVMPLLTLAAGGLAGGQFVLFAKEQIGKVLTGERILC